ncbi:hypothetical protein APV28_1709 [Comamonas testosteroni]|nr:hypothetical protein APV28_1709 [Comamonas testosteroni]
MKESWRESASSGGLCSGSRPGVSGKNRASRLPGRAQH